MKHLDSQVKEGVGRIPGEGLSSHNTADCQREYNVEG